MNVSATFTATLSVRYQVSGPQVLNTAKTQYVPDWAHSVRKPVPFVLVQMRDPGNNVAQQASLGSVATGVLGFSLSKRREDGDA